MTAGHIAKNNYLVLILDQNNKKNLSVSVLGLPYINGWLLKAHRSPHLAC
jgi:hypothetical protein